MSFVFAQVFVLQSVVKLYFLLVVLIVNFGDVIKLFIVIYLIFKSKSGRLFA